MEYQLKKKQLLAHVEYNNLLTFTLAENKLERNFRSIVDALLLNQAKTDAVDHELVQHKQNHASQMEKINQQLQIIKAQLQNQTAQQNNTSNQHLPSQKQLHNIPSSSNLQSQFFSLTDGLKLQQLMNDMNNKLNGLNNQSQNDKLDIMREINNLKNKLDEVTFQQQELKSLKNDMRNMNAQKPSQTLIKSNNTLSCRTLPKRSSVLNLIANKQSEKQIQQQSKKSSKTINKEQNNSQNKQNCQSIQNQNQKIHQASLNQAIEKEFNSLYLELNTMKISLEELKDRLSDNKKQTLKNNSLLTQLKDDLAREVKTRKYETEDLQKAIKDLKLQLLDAPRDLNSNLNQIQEKPNQQIHKNSKPQNKQSDDQFKNHINDKILRLQAMIQGLITESEFNRLKNDLNDQIERLNNKIDSSDQNLLNTQKKLEDLIVQNQVNTNSQFDDLKNRMALIEENSKNQANQNQRKNNILNAKNQELKKSLQNLREDLQFYQSLMAQNNKNAQNSSNKNNQNLQSKESQQQNNSSKIDQKALEGLKKYLGGKIHDLRTNLLSLIRDLQKKMNQKPNNDQEFIKIWDRLNEMNLFLGKKADNEDSKKTFMYLEKKINRLNSVMFKNEDNTEDARIAKTSWFCLSCDKNLQTYQGKVGKHVVWDSMPLKGVNKTFVNQVEEKKKGLPQLKK